MYCDFDFDNLFWCDRNFVPVGAKGIFGNSLHDVYVRVVDGPYTFSELLVGKKKSENIGNEKVFQKADGRWYSYFFLLELPAQAGYREYTKEEAEKFIGRTYHDITNPNELYDVSTVYESVVDGETVVFIDDEPASDFLAYFRWLDGSFCGVKL